MTRAAVRDDPKAEDIAERLSEWVNQLRKQWLPASHLPQQLVHGDVRLSNVCQSNDAQTVYLDFGFLAHRPRVHDLAYTLAFMALALGGSQAPENFAWQSVQQLVEAYEAEAPSRLTGVERKALAPYTAAMPLYAADLAGFSNDPVGLLRNRQPFLRLSEWVLTHPETLAG